MPSKFSSNDQIFPTKKALQTTTFQVSQSSLSSSSPLLIAYYINTTTMAENSKTSDSMYTKSTTSIQSSNRHP